MAWAHATSFVVRGSRVNGLGGGLWRKVDLILESSPAFLQEK